MFMQKPLWASLQLTSAESTKLKRTTDNHPPSFHSEADIKTQAPASRSLLSCPNIILCPCIICHFHIQNCVLSGVKRQLGHLCEMDINSDVKNHRAKWLSLFCTAEMMAAASNEPSRHDIMTQDLQPSWKPDKNRARHTLLPLYLKHLVKCSERRSNSLCWSVISTTNSLSGNSLCCW